jgi:hypothetical protein
MKKFGFIGFDHPQYWSGYHKPTVTVPVYNTMTNEDVADGIEEDLNACFSLFEDMTKEEETMLNDYVSELRKNPKEVFVNPAYEYDPEDDFFEAWNLYFSWVNPVWVNGIQFLDS